LKNTIIPFKFNNSDQIEDICKKNKLSAIIIEGARNEYPTKEFVKKKIYFTFLISRRTVIFRTKGFYYLRLLKNRGLVLGADNEKILGTRHRGFLTLESKKKDF
jgi:hypothetical protein